MQLVSESAGDTMDAGSPAKIALFSLGNLASHAECAAQLAALGIADVLASLANVQDAVVIKYCARIRVCSRLRTRTRSCEIPANSSRCTFDSAWLADGRMSL